MKFIHIADTHLGAKPEGLQNIVEKREKELWGTLEYVIRTCELEHMDFLFISGDVFHRQPLLRELKELNFLFSKLSHTQVVFIVGNHDHLKRDSYLNTFQWNKNVFPILTQGLGGVEFKNLSTAVYGFSYHQREIRDNRYEQMKAPRNQKHEILLLHGGDEKHMPLKKEKLLELGYDYIALGHLHKPQALVQDKIVFAGALEPTDQGDYGKHGYVRGEFTETGLKTSFVACAKREYIRLEMVVDETVTNGKLKETLLGTIKKYGEQNIYKFILKGYRDIDISFEIDELKKLGNILEIVDETNPAVDYERIAIRNEGNLLGKFIDSFEGAEPGTVEYEAMCEGAQALMGTKRNVR